MARCVRLWWLLWRCRHAHSSPWCRQCQACPFFSNPFLEFFLLTPSFSSNILFHIFVHAFDTLKIPEHRFATRNTLKKVICLSILQEPFLLLYDFHTKLMTLLFINFPLAVFYRQSLFCAVINKSQVNLHSSNSNFSHEFSCANPATPPVLVCESGHFDSSGPFVFETLVGTRTLHP